jgi:outer membrane protein assembly factor BamB
MFAVGLAVPPYLVKFRCGEASLWVWLRLAGECFPGIRSRRGTLFSFTPMKNDSPARGPHLSRLRKLSVLALWLTGAALPAFGASHWPAWRGPHGDGTSATAKDLPVTWSPDKNIKWKQEMPAWSGSSPVVWGDRIFVNSPSKEEVRPSTAPTEPTATAGPRARRAGRSPATRGPGGQELLLLCLSRTTGEELWRKQIDRGNQIRMKHNSSSPSPVTDGRHVWAVSGNGVIACFDLDGKEIWTFNIPEKFGAIGIGHGYGSSPLLLDDKLVVQVLHGQRTDDPSYIFALNANSGEVMWRVERPTDAIAESPDAYTTPAVLELEGKKQIVVLGGDYITGHAAETGAEVWRSGGLNPRKARDYRIVPSPTVRDGMIFAPTRQTPLLALRVGGKGDITDSHLAWSWTGRSAPDVPTPISDGPRFYMVDDAGQMTCLNAKTGAVIWGPEELGIGRVSSSPILADGKIYVTSETADIAVVEAGAKFKPLAKNSLDGSYTLSTPAAAGGELFVRTATHLYCIAE